ncbi:acylneuraminate cytidylyltransferase family protein [Albibacterium bauzanense]|uniref:N-acylneuraminate cytidylyltransferase/CMP-N,N'-diacetyllegionaminic acid synthase n=1 Tax=Albibacterium bauzanense TaxID=653929 RepID=A0A4R1M228_9SPHI|nr:acylneuraminate cytidylyltransferase family protein [Albibacterium bauzanense]TCK84894.1 N-acylneuraminate cytidylyltransferase/CMP-N,N'-diacetyllegionaminic acid synthase [Albibacterium bauzanense]
MLAIIPARSGSKGLPNKNIKPLLGKPLINYAIEAALKCPQITDVLVSTDSEEIANVAREAGAWVPELRPDSLAGDKSSSLDVIIHTLNYLKEHYSKEYEAIVFLQPTSPLRESDDINAAINLYQEKEADSVISYTQEAHPIFWHKYINENGTISDLFEGKDLFNRQEYQQTYFPNGSIYVVKTKLILEERKFYTPKTYAYIMPKNKSVDIDDIDDFQYAEYLLKTKINP